MKKALHVLLWLALIASAITLLSWNGQKETLAKEARTAKARQENLQNRYTQDQKDWKNQETALKAENDTLTQEKADLFSQLEDMRRKLENAKDRVDKMADREQKALDALKAAQSDFEAQVKNLSQEKEALSGRLDHILAVLLPVSGEEAEEGNLFAELTSPVDAPLPAPEKPINTPDALLEKE